MTTTLEEQFRRRPVDPVELARAKEEMRQYARAYRLREVREAQEMTQVDVAQELGIGQNRVSQIERGDIGRSRIDTLRRYVEALGGRLSVEAEFGDTRYVVVG
jgi:DNA-binding XRE family transcriptional regulator